MTEWTCPHCNQSFQRKSGLTVHVQCIHNPKKVVPRAPRHSGVPGTRCEICGVAWAEHLRCEGCGIGIGPAPHEAQWQQLYQSIGGRMLCIGCHRAAIVRWR